MHEKQCNVPHESNSMVLNLISIYDSLETSDGIEYSYFSVLSSTVWLDLDRNTSNSPWWPNQSYNKLSWFFYINSVALSWMSTFPSLRKRRFFSNFHMRYLQEADEGLPIRTYLFEIFKSLFSKKFYNSQCNTRTLYGLCSVKNLCFNTS